MLGIELLDHIVVAKQGHVSLRERGLYTPLMRDGTETGPNLSELGGLAYA